MKISKILQFMGFDFNILNDKDYYPTLNVKDFNIQILNNKTLDNESFHKNAKIFEKEMMIYKYIDLVSKILDEKARELGYKNSLYLISYTNSKNIEVQKYVRYFIDWRDDCERYLRKLIKDIRADNISIISLKDFTTYLPIFNKEEIK